MADRRRLRDATKAVMEVSVDTGTPKKKSHATTLATPSPSAKKSKIDVDRRTPTQTLIDRLREGCSCNKSKRWYLKEQREKRLTAGLEKANGGRTLSAYEKQRLWSEVLMLEAYLQSNVSPKPRHEESGKFKKRNAMHDPLTTGYLVQFAYGLGSQYLCRLRKEATDEDGSLLLVLPTKDIVKDKDKPKRSVIDDPEFAAKIYTAKHLFALNECKQAATDWFDSADREIYKVRYKEATERYEALPDETKEMWEYRRRNHLELQGSIKHIIMDALQKNPKRSCEALAADIDHWCSATTIWHWMTNRAGHKP